MSKTNSFVFVLTLATSAATLAQTPPPWTVDESSEMQGRIARAEGLAKLAEATKRAENANPPANIRSAQTRGAEKTNIIFTAEYGLGKNLFGEFEINGVPVTLSIQKQNDFEGWTTQRLTPLEADLVRRDKNGKVVERRTVALTGKAMQVAAPVTAPAIPALQPTGGQTGGNVVPDLRKAQ